MTAIHHAGEPAEGASGSDQRAVGATAVAGRGAVDEQPGRELLDEDGVAGHRPAGPPWLAVQPHLAEGTAGGVLPAEQPDTLAVPGELDIGGGSQPGRHGAAVLYQVHDRIRVAAAPPTVSTRDHHRVLAHRLHMGPAVVGGGQAGDRLDGAGVHDKYHRCRVAGDQQPQPGASLLWSTR